MESVTLLIVSAADIASTVQGDALLGRGGWDEAEPIEGGKTWMHMSQPVHIWWFPDSVLWEDELDGRYSSASGTEVREVVFLSRHSAASGRPSLTLHVIGVPGESPVGESAEYGGIKGAVVPPNQRFASWFRRMVQAAHDHAVGDEFDLTIETTHHGPSLSAPTMFIEIGSTESHWGRTDAAEVWADVIFEGLGLDGGPGLGDWDALSDSERAQSKVMLGIGGGHYAPRHTDVLRKTNCWAGHQIASYALEMERPEDESWDPQTGDLPRGQWEHAIRVCVESTRQSFLGGEVIAHLDRKSFKGWQRRSVIRLCEELDIPVGRTAAFE